MHNTDINIIIIKFFSHEVEPTELEQLDNWLKEPENREDFQRLQKLWFGAETLAVSSLNKEKAWGKYEKFMFSSQEEELKKPACRKVVMAFLKYAAIMVGVLMGSYLLYITSYPNETVPVVAEFTEMKVSESEEVFIRLESGEVVPLVEQEEKEMKATDGTIVQKEIGGKVEYHQDEKGEQKAVFHELCVPRGKRMDLVLADGTHVWLNSESVLKFPTRFDQKERVVQLEGEAYFEVAKNKKKPFIVKTSDLNVRVLGTSFNLSSYKSEEEINLTLVEGKVGLYKSETKCQRKKAVVVRPNQRATYSKKEKQMDLTDCDPTEYCVWREGKLSFKNEKFENLLIRLERWYDIYIINQNSEIENMAFTGDFDSEDIEQVLETLKRNVGLEYQIEGDIIKILP